MILLFSVGAKGKSAVEAHRAKMASLLQEQQKEDSIAAGMPEWQPPAMASRPESATQKEDRVKTRFYYDYTKLKITIFLYKLSDVNPRVHISL